MDGGQGSWPSSRPRVIVGSGSHFGPRGLESPSVTASLSDPTRHGCSARERAGRPSPPAERSRASDPARRPGSGGTQIPSGGRQACATLKRSFSVAKREPCSEPATARREDCSSSNRPPTVARARIERHRRLESGALRAPTISPPERVVRLRRGPRRPPGRARRPPPRPLWRRSALRVQRGQPGDRRYSRRPSYDGRFALLSGHYANTLPLIVGEPITLSPPNTVLRRGDGDR